MSTHPFEQALSAVLAHTIVYESRLRVDNELGHRDWFFVANGDPPPSTEGESTDEMMRAWINNLPALLQTQSNVTNMLAPQENAAALQLAQQFMPSFTQLGLDQNRQQALGQASTDLAVLEGPGKQLTAAALEAQRAADPEYYATRAASSDALAKLFSSLEDPTGELSGGERAEIERSVNRDNQASGIAAPTATSTVDNAMRFGSGSTMKKSQQQGAITQAVNTATGAAPTMKSGVDVMQMTLGRPSVQNAGMGQFAGTQELSAKNSAAGSALMGQIGSNMQNAQNINANRRDGLDRFSQVMGSIPSVSCCWIFRERYGAAIPWYLRASRDYHYTPEIRAGYQRMSLWLLPLLRRSKLARAVAEVVMFKPLTAHARWFCTREGNGWLFEPVKLFWLHLWSKLGERDGSSAKAYG
jgi:hypothetical protein